MHWPEPLRRLLGGGRAIDLAADPALLADCGERVRARLEGELGARNRGGRKASLFLFRDFLDRRSCARLIRLIDSEIGPSTLFNDGGAGTGGEDVRTSSTHYFADSHRDAAMLARRIDDLLGLDRAHAETMQGQRYLPGEQYRHHCDFFHTERAHWHRERLRGGQRTWTAMVYLNDVESGGATEFSRLALSIQPEPGMLLVWDNMTRGGRPNRATIHAGLSVETGAKYVVTQWYRQNAWVRHPS